MLHQELANPLGVIVGMLPQGPANGLLNKEIRMLAILQNVACPYLWIRHDSALFYVILHDSTRCTYMWETIASKPENMIETLSSCCS